MVLDFGCTNEICRCLEAGQKTRTENKSQKSGTGVVGLGGTWVVAERLETGQFLGVNLLVKAEEH